ncbi:ABC-three component system middle component 1 [Bacillus taeanensis]|uniref:Uncharacterized protein n=1 Tax=Bacillus taeanensis TaxID=273032 RepID=A0A366XRQ6_9BACI|nr:ABC-three component system middle component 1 [Bacillus taeanensis]RBW68218.1 hypothetical protein DS031_17735 [Bacillus taeanensis]
MFLKDKGVVDSIKIQSSNGIFDIVDCWIKKEEGYKIHIFTIVCKDQEELEKVWERVSSDIALYFQSNLEIDIEIWNIYILFIVREQVNNEYRYFLEQNKFSSRKLIVDKIADSLSEKDIEKIVFEKLFYLKLEKDKRDKNEESIHAFLREKHKEVYRIITEYNDKPSDLFNKYLEVLK